MNSRLNIELSIRALRVSLCNVRPVSRWNDTVYGILILVLAIGSFSLPDCAQAESGVIQGGTLKTSEVAPNAAIDYSVAGPRCGNQGETGMLHTLHLRINILGAILPNVPPEEANYLEAEEKSIYDLETMEHYSKVDQGSRARFSNLYSRPLYRVYETRKALIDFTKRLKLIDQDPPKLYTYADTDAEQLERALNSLYYADSLEKELAQLEHQFGAGAAAWMTKDQFTKIDEIENSLVMELSEFSSCKLARLTIRQHIQ